VIILDVLAVLVDDLLVSAFDDGVTRAWADLAPLGRGFLDLLRQVLLRRCLLRRRVVLRRTRAAVGLRLAAGLLAVADDLRDFLSVLRLPHLLGLTLAGLRRAAGTRLPARLFDQQVEIVQDAILDDL